VALLDAQRARREPGGSLGRSRNCARPNASSSTLVPSQPVRSCATISPRRPRARDRGCPPRRPSISATGALRARRQQHGVEIGQHRRHVRARADHVRARLDPGGSARMRRSSDAAQLAVADEDEVQAR
jgi:hypothetical protein